MIIYGALLIPIISAIILYKFFHKHIAWFEFVIPLAASIILVVISKAVIKHTQLQCKEYWGSMVQRVEYYEEWNEYIHRTCTRSCGKGCTTTYDCSYVEAHPPVYKIITTTNETITIAGNEYARICMQFGNKTFVELNRHYYTDDGDLYVSAWPGDSLKAIPVTTVHHYTNKVKAADQSVFHFKPVHKPDRIKYDLKEYPPITNKYEMNAVIGDSSIDAYYANKKLQYINGDLGPTKELKLFVLVFKNQPLEAGFYQEWYWSGGNKNEFIITVGIDGNRNVQWCHPISWTPAEELKVEIKDFVQAQHQLNLQAIADYAYPRLKQEFVRKNFDEFNYLTVKPPVPAVIMTYLLTILVNLFVCLWAIKNDIE